MKRLMVCIVLLCSFTSVVAFAQGESQPAPQEGTSKQSIMTALLRLETSTISVLTGKTGSQELAAKMNLLSSGQPSGDFTGLNGEHVKMLYFTWKDWQHSKTPEALRKYLAAIDQAKRKYSTDLHGTYSGLWEMLEFKIKGSSDEANKLIQSAAQDADWIRQNLSGLTISREGEESLASLYRALSDYEVTHDSHILEILAADLRLKVKHCEESGTRADEPTKITFDTIDANNKKHDNWTVFAVPTTNVTRRPFRIGNPSTPVTGSLIPGRYFFYAEREGRQSKWEEFTVCLGKIDPPNVRLIQ